MSLHWTFLALLGYLAWEGWNVGGWLGSAWLLGFVLAAFTCVVLHEFGHALMAKRFGVNTAAVVLFPIGGMAAFDRIPRRPAQELLIALAGPAVNVVLVLMGFALGVRFPPDWNPLWLPATLAELARYLVAVNIVMALFNLLPIFPMDGGRVLRALLSLRLDYLVATRWAVGLSKALALAGIALFIWLPWPDPHWMGIALLAFIFVAGELELRNLRRQLADEERWRQTLARFYRDAGLPPPL